MSQPSPDLEPQKQSGEEDLISLENFYLQIQSIPSLVQQAVVIDHVLTNYFKELKETAEKIVLHFSEEKQKLLSQLDSWLVPVASEVLEELLQDAIQLKDELNETIQSLKKSSEMNWPAHCKNWEDLYKKWHDRKELSKKILALLSEKTNHLIEKDIRLIQEYQNQTLNKLARNKKYQNLERRLVKATAEPLKHLLELKVTIQMNSSMKQASDWVAQLQTQRESYFDQVLMKIDAIVKEAVQIDEEGEGDHSKELEGELKFVEEEFKQIRQLVSNLEKSNSSEYNYAKNRLEEMKEHLMPFLDDSLPTSLKRHLDKLVTRINTTLSELD